MVVPGAFAAGAPDGKGDLLCGALAVSLLILLTADRQKLTALGGGFDLRVAGAALAAVARKRR